MARRQKMCCGGRPVWMLLVLSVTVATVDGVSNCPPGGSYYDKNTGRSECCFEICEHAELMRTEDACNKFCPGYKASAIPAALAHLKAQPEPPTGSHISPGLTATLVVAAVLIVTVLGAFVIKNRQSLRQRVVAWGRCNNNNNNNNPPDHVEGQHHEMAVLQNLMDLEAQPLHGELLQHGVSDDDGGGAAYAAAARPEGGHLRDVGGQPPSGPDAAQQFGQPQLGADAAHAQRYFGQVREAQPPRRPVPETGGAQLGFGVHEEGLANNNNSNSARQELHGFYRRSFEMVLTVNWTERKHLMS